VIEATVSLSGGARWVADCPGPERQSPGTWRRRSGPL